MRVCNGCGKEFSVWDILTMCYPDYRNPSTRKHGRKPLYCDLCKKLRKGIPVSNSKYMSKTQYLKNNGARCPVCKSLNIESGQLSADGSIAIADVTCQDCNATWQDHWKLTGYFGLQEALCQNTQ